jgi:uncharacterized 2Fe-2S/4Fe-4S cluster protein (DUF4445 family)
MHQIEIENPCQLSTYLREQRIALKMSCGGHGSCKTCRVMLDGQPVLACQTDMDPGSYDLTVPQSNTDSSNIQIDMSDLEEGLACQSPRWSIVEQTVSRSEEIPGMSNRQRLEKVLNGNGLSIASSLMDGTRSDAFEGSVELAVHDGKAVQLLLHDTPCKYAFAVDIGTTTLAAALIDLETREIVHSAGRLNGQYAYAEDLVARIAFCHTADLLGEMQELGLKRSLIPLLKSILKEAGIKPDQVLTTRLSGNAPMIHILLGYDPTGMGAWPFNGIDYAPAPRPAADFRIPGRMLEFTPSQSAYLGADIVSGLALVDFENAPNGTLFVDLGTNAEMALKAEGKLICTAVPAGPSFEGGGFPCGISAIPGAIDRVTNADGRLDYTTIGDAEPVGLCGSGIVSFVAAAFRAKILRKKGRLSQRHECVEQRELLGQNQRVYAFTETLYVSEDDISNFLQAKAAVFSGIMTLCKVAGMDPLQLDRLYLAGNFGRRVQIEDLIDVGIIPPLLDDKIIVCGNTSLKGAIYASLDSEADKRARRIVEQLTFIELNAQESFQNDFINALFIPHLTMDFQRH